tara:strand:+ start:39 stop:242 length:204 start_codon:yes stop_codon:yes gene_type:complete
MKKNMVMHKGKMVPDYAADGKGSGDLKKAKAGMIAETDMMQYGKYGAVKYGKGGYKMERRNKNYSKK